jgi:hypothetical protein
MLYKLNNGPIRIISIMSQKRARCLQSPVSQQDSNNQPSFNFDHVRDSHSAPGTTDAVLEVLRNMSNTHKRNSKKGHIIHITVNEFYEWLLSDVTPKKFIDCFSEEVVLDDESVFEVFKNLSPSLELSETMGAFFQQYLLYDRVYASVNRRKVKVLSGSKMLRSLMCFKHGVIAMKLAKAVPCDHGPEITEISFSDLPSKERSIFLETTIPFFVFSDLDSAEECEYIKINYRTN